MFGKFFLKQEDWFAAFAVFARLEVQFGRYAYAVNKFTLGANGF